MADLSDNSPIAEAAPMASPSQANNDDNTATQPAIIVTAPAATGDQCPICHEPIKELKKTVCSHTFCLECISEWLMEAYDCPVCHTELCPRLNRDNDDGDEGKEEEEDEDEWEEDEEALAREHESFRILLREERGRNDYSIVYNTDGDMIGRRTADGSIGPLLEEDEFEEDDIGWEYHDFEEEYGFPRPDGGPLFREMWE